MRPQRFPLLQKTRSESVHPPASLRFTFAAAIFSAAFLLFFVELLLGKLILPGLGGTPAVWTSCLLVFQMLLLAGMILPQRWLYHHVLARSRNFYGMVTVVVSTEALHRISVPFPGTAKPIWWTDEYSNLAQLLR